VGWEGVDGKAEAAWHSSGCRKAAAKTTQLGTAQGCQPQVPGFVGMCGSGTQTQVVMRPNSSDRALQMLGRQVK
jgi:hypothetical protein